MLDLRISQHSELGACSPALLHACPTRSRAPVCRPPLLADSLHQGPEIHPALRRGPLSHTRPTASLCHAPQVMACPSGCINGGAQPRPPTGVDPREYATGVTAALAAASVPEDADSALQRVYSLLGAEGVGSQTAKQVTRAPPPPPSPPPLLPSLIEHAPLTRRRSISTQGSQTCKRKVWSKEVKKAWSTSAARACSGEV